MSQAELAQKALAQKELAQRPALAQKEWLTAKELEEIGGPSESTSAKWRMQGIGPAFVKVGRSVRYHLPTYRRWAAAHERRSTSDAIEERLRRGDPVLTSSLESLHPESLHP